MRKIILASALTVLGLGSAGAQTPQPADWTVLTFTADTNKAANVTWDRIGGHDWCGIPRFLKSPYGLHHQFGQGRSGLGANRDGGNHPDGGNGGCAHGRCSYTYAHPFTPIFYHGTMGVEPVDATHSKIVYTLIWNQTPVGDGPSPSHSSRSPSEELSSWAVDKMALGGRTRASNRAARQGPACPGHPYPPGHGWPALKRP